MLLAGAGGAAASSVPAGVEHKSKARSGLASARSPRGGSVRNCSRLHLFLLISLMRQVKMQLGKRC